MNLRRGLFRLWLVASLLWTAGAYTLFAPSIFSEFNKAYSTPEWKSLASLLLPVPCDQVRGGEEPDWRGPAGDRAVSASTPIACWYDIKRFRALYPEYADLSELELEEKTYAAIGQRVEQPHPWQVLARATAFALSAPITALLVGAALFWVASGFKHRDPF